MVIALIRIYLYWSLVVKSRLCSCLRRWQINMHFSHICNVIHLSKFDRVRRSQGSIINDLRKTYGFLFTPSPCRFTVLNPSLDLVHLLSEYMCSWWGYHLWLAPNGAPICLPKMNAPFMWQGRMEGNYVLEGRRGNPRRWGEVWRPVCNFARHAINL